MKKNKSDFCINIKDGLIKGVKNKKINYQYWYDVYYSLSSTALFTKESPQVQYLFQMKTSLFLIVVRDTLPKLKKVKIITIFNLDSNYQLEFERRSSMEKLANIF